MMLDGGPGVECGKLHTNDLKAQVLSNLAPEYSETKSYQKSDWCVHEGVTYRANEDITYDGTNPNSWDSTKWVQKEIVDNIPVIQAEYNWSTRKYEFVGDTPDFGSVSAAILWVVCHTNASRLALLGSNVGYGVFAWVGTKYEVNEHAIVSYEWNCNASSTPGELYYSFNSYDLSYNIAQDWDNDTTYAAGARCIYGNILYRCVNAESGYDRGWTPANWQEVKVTDLIDEIGALIPSNATPSNQLVTQSDLSAFINGAFEVVSLTSGSNPVPDVASPSTKVIYLTKEAGSQETDPYTEWIWAAQGTDPETYAWEVIGETTPDLSVFSGSTPGLVPAATASDANKALKGDGTWGDVSNVSVSYDAVNEELHLDFSPQQQNDNP